MTKYEPVRLVKDEGDNWYTIPNNLVDEFHKDVDHVMQSLFLTSIASELIADFEHKYKPYRVSGMNERQLYVRREASDVHAENVKWLQKIL